MTLEERVCRWIRYTRMNSRKYNAENMKSRCITNKLEVIDNYILSEHIIIFFNKSTGSVTVTSRLYYKYKQITLGHRTFRNCNDPESIEKYKKNLESCIEYQKRNTEKIRANERTRRTKSKDLVFNEYLKSLEEVPDFEDGVL